MTQTTIVQERLIEGNKLLLGLSVEMKNASLIFLSEEEDSLGTLAVAIPQAQKLVGPPLSAVLLGDRNMINSRALAERLAEKMGKIVLVSVFTKTLDDRESGPILYKLVEKIVEKMRGTK